MLGPWLRFFRIVNLPTVPGDVLVGAAAVGLAVPVAGRPIATAAVAACCLYLFGLADNDIVGAATDSDRPIPSGEISLAAARLARGLCLGGALLAGALGSLPPSWWIGAALLALVIAVYNRTKSCILMGLCRGLDVVCGGLALLSGGIGGFASKGLLALLCAALVFTAYIASVTKASEGEETDPIRKQMIGHLIGALVYLQLGALVVFTLMQPSSRRLLLAGAVLLVVLRMTKRHLPKVSAS